jgi:hypothetical protein
MCRSIYELYTLCEYDCNAERTSEVLTLLRQGTIDMDEVRAGAGARGLRWQLWPPASRIRGVT